MERGNLYTSAWEHVFLSLGINTYTLAGPLPAAIQAFAPTAEAITCSKPVHLMHHMNS